MTPSPGGYPLKKSPALAFTSLLVLLRLSGGTAVAAAADDPGAAGGSKRPLTVADGIETTRAQGGTVYEVDRDDEPNPVVVSPGGRRYATMLIRGDLKRDGNILELVSGRLDSLDAAARVETVGSLFSRSLGDPDDIYHTRLTFPGGNPIVWLDDDTLVFFWEDDRGLVQAYSANVAKREIRPLTNHPTNLSTFALASSSTGTVLYAAYSPHSDVKSQQMLHDGFVVTNDDAFSTVDGHVDGESMLSRAWNLDWFVREGDREPVRLEVSGRGHIPSTAFLASLSPDGRFAIVDDSPPDVPESWEKYTDDFTHEMVTQARTISRETFEAKQLKQLFVVDLKSRTARLLWNALEFRSYLNNVAWSPDGRSVLVGPTFLPAEKSDADGLAGNAVVEIEVATGRWRRLPIVVKSEDAKYRGLRWIGRDEVAVESKQGVRRFRRSGDAWRAAASNTNAASKMAAAPIRIEVRQALNTPPALFAVETKTRRERRILDLNPGLLSTFKLGRAEKAEWKDKSGQTWSGLLYYPAEYQKGRRYPLVVQTHGVYAYDKFSLYGYGVGLGTGAGVYAAQSLAGRGVAVLQVEDKRSAQNEDAQTHMSGYEAAVQHLVDSGLVDPGKVGLQGFSRTGWYVEYMLTHSDFRYAAALAADNISGGYVESTLSEPGTMETENGGAPFGEGLKHWLANSPGFNAERSHTPLRIVLQSGPLSFVLSHWELFGRLRRLGKPVELYVMPDVEHGSHTPQNPRQVYALQEGAVDWFDFWLNGHEDPASAKGEQYARWRKLRELNEADRKAIKQEAAGASK